MIPRVIGLDLSLAATGVADNRIDGHILTSTIPMAPPGKDPVAQWRRIRRIGERITEVVEQGTRPALVTVEGPSYGSKGDTVHQLAGLWWHIVGDLLNLRLGVAVVTPGNLKKYATGKGSSTKSDMRMALYQRARIDERDDNRVDAWFLAAMALDHLGHPPVDLPHRAALEKVAWPEGVA